MKTNFTPGPSQLYFTVEDHVRRAFREGIPSLSHRTREFESIYATVSGNLRELLTIPDTFHILFASSATEIWERSIENLVERDSLHLVNGAFSSRFHEIAKQLGRNATRVDAEEGQGFSTLPSFSATELIALTHNETSTGVSLDLDFIHSFRSAFPNSLIVVDAVSSLPYPAFDYTAIDAVFFSVQKAFGLPAGLGVWIVNDRCVEKAHQIQAKGISIGTYHSLPSLVSHSKKNQTPETPNVLGIYLLSKVLEDFNRRGISQLRKETEYKAALLYHALETNARTAPFVKDKTQQSKTVIVADCGTHLQEISGALRAKNLYPGDGYGNRKSTQLRFANFPTHSKEQYELLVDTLSSV